MSTFKGIVAEFPQIRIDYFRQQPDHTAPLACFLSHVHSDHLVGLESLRAPFVYCSAATREILLRLEKYHYRINFARGILESRNVTYDKSMRRLAKPLPLETPTVIELAPENKIRVTLFDANHCVGAVMFLIEGHGKAILYTGDTRAEPWWVNSLVQNSLLLPYTLGSRRLDCIYLDTTFATKSEPYREFPTKAEGLRELLAKVEQCPQDTIFYFHSWTFGYENVWVALSAYLDSQIHLDDYRARIYRSLSPLSNKALLNSGLEIREAPALCGFRNGNHVQPGCLTSEPSVRLHSCERGMGCPIADHDKDSNLVHIIPIVTRANGTEIAELGAGGGHGDLDQKEELETADVAELGMLMDLCASKIDDAQLLSKVLARLQEASSCKTGKIDVNTRIQNESQASSDDLTLQTLVSILAQHAENATKLDTLHNRTIRFPYSRHSSYSELCALVDAFKPQDVFPCTVDDENWSLALGMRSLFGQFCSADVFRHDAEMMADYDSRQQREYKGKRKSERRSHSDGDLQTSAPKLRQHVSRCPTPAGTSEPPEMATLAEPLADTSQTHDLTSSLGQTGSASIQQSSYTTAPEVSTAIPDSSSSTSKAKMSSTARSVKENSKEKQTSKRSNRQIAYNAAMGFGLTWSEYGGLVSTRNSNEREEQEL